jgi:Phosphoribosylformylglycinamidine (FGAM) synthase
MKATVVVTLKPEVLDPQGDAVRRALGKLGFEGVKGVRVGKIIEIELDDGQGRAPTASGGWPTRCSPTPSSKTSRSSSETRAAPALHADVAGCNAPRHVRADGSQADGGRHEEEREQRQRDDRKNGAPQSERLRARRWVIESRAPGT